MDDLKVVWTMDGGSQLLFVSDDGQHVAMIYGGSTLIPLDADDSRDLIIFLGSWTQSGIDPSSHVGA